jgi:hypothetical protein
VTVGAYDENVQPPTETTKYNQITN